MAGEVGLPTPAEIPPFEMRPDGVREFMAGAIKTIVTNARTLKSMGDNPQIREHQWDQRRKDNAAIEAGLMAAAGAFDIASPRRDEDQKEKDQREGWPGFIRRHVAEALNPSVD